METPGKLTKGRAGLKGCKIRERAESLKQVTEKSNLL